MIQRSTLAPHGLPLPRLDRGINRETGPMTVRSGPRSTPGLVPGAGSVPGGNRRVFLFTLTVLRQALCLPTGNCNVNLMGRPMDSPAWRGSC